MMIKGHNIRTSNWGSVDVNVPTNCEWKYFYYLFGHVIWLFVHLNHFLCCGASLISSFTARLDERGNHRNKEKTRESFMGVTNIFFSQLYSYAEVPNNLCEAIWFDRGVNIWMFFNIVQYELEHYFIQMVQRIYHFHVSRSPVAIHVHFYANHKHPL